MKDAILKILEEKKININRINGWEISEIEFFEGTYLNCQKYPLAIRTYLEIAGNIIDLTRSSYIQSFYKYELKNGGLNDKIKEWANGKEVCIVAYYAEGDFVWFSFLNDNEDPEIFMNEYTPVYTNEVDSPSSYKITFKKVADRFTDFIKSMLTEQ